VGSKPDARIERRSLRVPLSVSDSRLERAAYALLPLRAFLGFTFCYAGLQKLANPAFFNARSPISIQAQFLGAVRRSPIHALLQPLSSHAWAIGVLMALGELAVGLGTLAGLFTRIAALGGAVISFSLFLTVSFHSNPWYTGSDIVFFFAWLPLLVAGGGPFSLDAWVDRAVQRRASSRARADVPPDEMRRRLVGSLAVLLGAFGMALAGLTAGIGRLLYTPATSGATSALPGGGSPGLARPSPSGGTAAGGTPSGGAASGNPSPAGGPSAGASSPGASSGGVRIGPASAVPIGGAASFQDPATGDPAIVVRPSAGVFHAFDAVCPHAGCTVGYDPSSAVLVCPCHGSRFNATSGAVLNGPAPTGLTPIKIREGSDGQLYVD